MQRPVAAVEAKRSPLGSEPTPPTSELTGHPRAVAPTMLAALVLVSAIGAIIGVQLLSTLGVTPNTSLVGVVMAMILGRLPLFGLRLFRSVHAQNLAQSAMSAATYGAANSLLLPIGIPWLLGRPDLVLPLLGGVALAMALDAYLLFRMFGTQIFPADAPWPLGLAAAEAIKAGDRGGQQGTVLLVSVVCGAIGAWLKLPMAAFGTAFIGNVWALSMFGIGLLASGYSAVVFGYTLQSQYVPHGMMIGAGLVALVQVWRTMRTQPAADRGHMGRTVQNGHTLQSTLGIGWAGYIALALVLAVSTRITSELSIAALAAFVLFAAAAAFIHELIVGLAAMHSGWFPAFAVALITLLVGMLLGFPPIALGLLTGFTAATGPAFADMGYNLKAGFVLRDCGASSAFEMSGRREQFLASMVGFATALLVVLLAWRSYFVAGLVPPVDRVYAATINAGAASGVGRSLLLWAIPGALLQLAGGPTRQLGVLLSTGLLISNPVAGWGVVAGVIVRILWARASGRQGGLDVVAAGFIAGDALFSFGDSMIRQHTTPPGARL